MEEARKTLHQSIDQFPCNWGAWKALQVASGGADAPLADPTLPKHWMREFYLASLCLESRENEEGLSRLQVNLTTHNLYAAFQTVLITEWQDLRHALIMG